MKGFYRKQGRGPLSLLLLTVLGTFLLAACGNDSSPSGSGPNSGGTSPEEAEAPEVNWDTNYIIGGVTLGSLSEAADYVDFNPVTSPQVPSPKDVYVTPRSAPPLGQMLVLGFQTSRYGYFQIQEELTQGPNPDQDLVTLGESCAAEGACESDVDLITLDNGKVALTISGAGSNQVIWNWHGLRLTVLGPPDSFTIDDAVEIANFTT